MRERLRFRSVGVLAALGTAAAMAATMALAVPGGAQTPLKEYSLTFEPECVVAPGVLNIRAKLRTNIRAMGPESVMPGEEFNWTEASSSITSPAELTETFVALGISEIRGHIQRFVLDGAEKDAEGEVVGGKNLEPSEINAAEPSEYPSGLPFFAPVEKGKAVTFGAPALKLGETGRTYTYGPERVTGLRGESAMLVVEPAVIEEEDRSWLQVPDQRDRLRNRRLQRKG